MSADFVPDDDRDPDDGWDSMEDYLRDRGDDMEYADSTEIDTTKVDVDPALFGEFPVGDIDVSSTEGVGPVGPDEVREWEREITLIRVGGMCPHCDGPIDRDVFENPDGREVVDWQCEHCDEQWLALAVELDGSVSMSGFKAE